MIVAVAGRTGTLSVMTHDDLFATLAVAAVLTAVGVAAALLKKSGRKRFENLAPAFDFGTSRKIGFFATAVEGLFNGYSCRYTIHPASQHSPGGASLRVAVHAPGEWSAELANTGSRLMVKIGLLRDLKVGDPELDLRLRFTADDAGSLHRLFGIEGVRTAIREVLATENFAGARLRKGGLEVRWSPRNPRLDEDADVLRRRLKAAAKITSACGYPPSLGD